jgi:methyltransferase (TIGR00027 family)
VAPKGLRARLGRMYLERHAHVMVPRTVAIDDAIREARSPQLVIVGAGLDGRAWRMPELDGVVVFEVDHPDSQRDKKARAAALTRAASEVRFVAVDFQHDDLNTALSDAGHDTSRPTTWIWEGVVMYLSPAEVERTLATIRRRSAPQSRVVVLYHAPALILHLVRPLLRRLGEPLRSHHTQEAMSALLGSYGFDVVRDEDVATIGARLSHELAKTTKFAKHLRLVVADRTPELFGQNEGVSYCAP